MPPPVLFSSLQPTAQHFRRVGQFFLSSLLGILFSCQLREMFLSTCGFPPQFYNIHLDLRQPVATMYSQDYDLLLRPGSTLQQQPMESIPAADSSRAYTIIFNLDEQKCIVGRMKKTRLISDSTTKTLTQHHVQLLNTTFANKKKCLDCFKDKTKISLEKQAQDQCCASGDA